MKIKTPLITMTKGVTEVVKYEGSCHVIASQRGTTYTMKKRPTKILQEKQKPQYVKVILFRLNKRKEGRKGKKEISTNVIQNEDLRHISTKGSQDLSIVKTYNGEETRP